MLSPKTGNFQAIGGAQWLEFMELDNTCFGLYKDGDGFVLISPHCSGVDKMGTVMSDNRLGGLSYRKSTRLNPVVAI